jgi:uncharacterized membrane protein
VEIRNAYHKFTLWWTGLFLIVGGAIADFAALTFSPQSLVAPLGSLTLVSNILVAPWVLKEVVTTRDIISTLIIVSGCIISVAFAAHVDVVYSLDSLFSFFLHWTFIIYACLVIGFLICTITLINHFESIEHDPIRYTPTKETWHRLAYPAAAGTIGAQSVLFAKCLIEMIVNAFQHRGLFLTRWQGYFVVVALVVCIVLQIKWLNDGLLRFDSAYEVPIFQAFWVVLSVVSGMVFFSEWKTMSMLQLGLFLVGIIVTVTGVILLSRGRRVYRPNAGSTGESHNDDESPEVPDRVCGGDDRERARQARMSGAQGYGWVHDSDSDDLSDDDDMPAAPLLRDQPVRVIRD